MRNLLLALLGSLLLAAPLQGQLAAFPGAEGWGASALQTCRSLPLEVLQVTSLASSGAGTLRQALLDARSDRFSVIIFRTGGTITASYIEVPNSCIYVAGQTAPGDGVQINAGGGVVFRLPRTGPTDLVFRYLRLRSGKGTPGEADGIAFDGGSRVIFDHVSIQWANDENIGMQTVVQNSGTYPRAPIRDVTFQRVNNSAALRTHSAGLLIGGAVGSGQPIIERVSIHHSLFAHNAHRNPRVAENDNIDFANNIVYNWHTRVGATTYTANVDYRNNYLKAGPWSDPNTIYYHDGRGAGEGYEPRVYLTGNIATPLQPDSSADQTNLFRFQQPNESFADAPAQFFRASPQTAATIPVTLQTAAAAYASVLADVGANASLTCEGVWQDALDPLDSLIINHVETGTGPTQESETDHEDDYGGFPSLAAGSACADGDSDGLPDAWETLTGTTSPSTVMADSYLAIEHYLNGVESEEPPAPPARRFRAFLCSIAYTVGVGIDWTPCDRSGLENVALAAQKPDRTQAIVMTYDSLTAVPYLSDAALDSIAADWGYDGDDLRATRIPGEDE